VVSHLGVKSWERIEPPFPRLTARKIASSGLKLAIYLDALGPHFVSREGIVILFLLREARGCMEAFGAAVYREGAVIAQPFGRLSPAGFH
jgi:hypothetical protein